MQRETSVNISAPCPLCRFGNTAPHFEDATSRYLRCPDCTLIHRDASQWPTLEEERSRYLLHRNDPGDVGYVAFLRQLSDAVISQLRSDAQGLDFGCGPAPVLSSMLTSAGFPCEPYDPLFFPRDELLLRSYDFVVCSEVVEHLHDPAGAFALLGELLAKGGVLGIMTRFYPAPASFGSWWYRRDATHVCFYSESVMRWIAERQGWDVDFPAPDVTLFRVSPPSRASAESTRDT